MDQTGYVLTCGHVLDPDGSGIALPINIQAMPPIVGQHPSVLSIKRGDMSITSSSDNLDAAICKVPLPAGATVQTHDGKPVRELQDPQDNGSYEMYSRKLPGVVTGQEPDLYARFRIGGIGPSNDWAIINHVFVLPMKAAKGDSGSLLYTVLPDDQGVAAVGILVAVFDGHAVFHELRAVLSAFNKYENIHLQLGVPPPVPI
jgi:hypothetical protein